MDRIEQVIQAIRDQKLLPLFYHWNDSVCLDVTKALYKGGIRAIEFTNRGPAALENFNILVKARNEEMQDLLLSVGTIKTAAQAKQFIESGADFLVSPVFDSAIADVAKSKKILWIPGCMTPTEIHTAANAGCRLIKLFPGTVLRPSFVTAIKELFPDLYFMPTGGVDVTKKNLTDWFSAGVSAVGIGSRLITNEILEEKYFKSLTKETKKLLKIVRKL